MSEKRAWVSPDWPEDAAPYDHIRSRYGVLEIFEEYIGNRWENGGHNGLIVLGQTIRHAANAFDSYLEGLERKGLITAKERLGGHILAEADDADADEAETHGGANG